MLTNQTLASRRGGVSDDGGSNPLSGITVVKADSIDAAVEMAKGCPHLDHGTIEVVQMLDMEMQPGVGCVLARTNSPQKTGEGVEYRFDRV